MAWRIVLTGNAVLEREAQQHAGVTRDARDVCPGLADADEHFAERPSA